MFIQCTSSIEYKIIPSVESVNVDALRLIAGCVKLLKEHYLNISDFNV